MHASLGGLALVGTLLVTGCTSEADPDSDADHDDGPAMAEVAWEIADGTPLTQVHRVAPGTGAYFAEVDGSGVELRGIDIATGEVRWSAAASSGPDFFLVRQIGGRVAFLAPSELEGFGHPAVVDVDSGAVTRSAARLSTDSFFHPCAGHKGSICTRGRVPGDTSQQSFRLAGRDLRLVSSTADDSGDGLDFDDGTVTLMKNGRSVWSHPWSDVMDGMASSRFSYHPDPAMGAYLISGHRGDATDSLRARDIGVVAVSVETGERLWSKWGVESTPILPPANSGLSRESDPPVAVLCRYRGQVVEPTQQQESDPTHVLGVDWETGRRIWQLPTSDGVGCSLPTNDGRTAYVEIDGQRSRLDLVTGETSAAGADEIAWTATQRIVKVGGQDVTVTANYEPRTEDGLASEFPWPLPSGLGARADGVHGLMVGGKVRGYVEGD